MERCPTKKHKIDYLRGLLLRDEEAYDVRPEDELIVSDPRYDFRVGIDEQGKRILYEPDARSEEAYHADLRDDGIRTEKYRRFIQRKLQFWVNALTDEGPSAHLQLGEDTSSVSRPLVHFRKRDQFANLLDLVYETYFEHNGIKLCTKTEFFNRLAPLFSDSAQPEQPYDGNALRKAASRTRIEPDEAKTNRDLIARSLKPPDTP